MIEPAVVTHLYRYPAKSFTPEERDALNILDNGRVQGDRVLAVQLGDAGDAPREATGTGEGWWPKEHFICLMTTPGIIRLRLHFDDTSRRMRIEQAGEVVVEANIDDETGRTEIAQAVEAFVRTLDERPDLDRAGRTPLRVVGDGELSRFHDYPAGYVTLHSRASLQALGAALDDDALDQRRFRSNIVVEGLDAWEELGWVDRTVRIGDMRFEATRPVVRCLATHASPSEGVRDREVLKTLPQVNGHDQPVFAVALTPQTNGVIRIGDALTVE